MGKFTDTEVLAFDSQSPSLSPLYRTVIVNAERQEFQDRVSLDDITVADSPVRLDDETELVDLQDCLEEVVPDSDDEICEASVLGATNLPKTDADAHQDLGGILFAESDASNEQTGSKGSIGEIVKGYGVKAPSQMIIDDHIARSNFMGSQEPGESTQANALEFIDHFIMDNAFYMSPTIDQAKVLRVKSPPVLRAKGPQCLAKRIESRTLISQRRTFDWSDNSQHARNRSNHPVLNPVNSRNSEESCRTEQENEAVPVNMFVRQIDEQLEEKNSKQQLETLEDFFDVGINTQIAAEAIGALSHMAHGCWSTNNADESLGNTLEDSPRDLMKMKVDESVCSVPNNPRPCIGGTARNSTRRRSGRTRKKYLDKREINNCSLESPSLTQKLKRRGPDGDQFVTLEGSKRKRKSTQIARKNPCVDAMTVLLKLDTWDIPRRKRSRFIEASQKIAAKKQSAPIITNYREEFKTESICCQKSLTCNKKVAFNRSEEQASKNSIDPRSLTYPKNISSGYHKTPSKKKLPKKSLLKELVSLGVPDVVADITWRDLRRRKSTAYTRVLFSQHLEEDVIKQQRKIAARLGISLADSSTNATHFVADQFARTRNMLEAMALGKPVVTRLWLESCGEASCLIDEKSYILRDDKKEKEIGFCMPTSLARASKSPLLEGVTVFITPNIKPEREMIVSLVKAVHGQVVESNHIFKAEDQMISDPLLILSCEEDQEICHPLITRGVAVYSSELLLNVIVTQKLNYERYSLFKKVNEKCRRRPAKSQACRRY